MRSIAPLLATAALFSAAAFAAIPPTSTAAPAAGAASTTSMPAKDCAAQAKEKGLKGAEKTTFMKTCKADQKAHK